MNTLNFAGGVSVQEIREYLPMVIGKVTCFEMKAKSVTKRMTLKDIENYSKATWLFNVTCAVQYGNVKGGKFKPNQIDQNKMAKKKEEKTKPVDNRSELTKEIDKLLKAGGHTVGQAVAKLEKKFPDIDRKKLSRSCHSRAAAAKKRDESHKWEPSAGPTGTGYMAKIDELLFDGKLTTREIADAVAKEFDKPVESAKKVVRARLGKHRRDGKVVNPPLEKDKFPPKKKEEKKAPAKKTTKKKAAAKKTTKKKK